MQRLWMAVTPGPLVTRVVVMDGARQSLLETSLPHGPQHPQALQRLCEALALWFGQPLHVVLAVDGADAFCATRPWLETFEQLTRRALYEIECVEALAAPEDEGGFADVRQLLGARMAR
jgi:hypothetical protein